MTLTGWIWHSDRVWWYWQISWLIFPFRPPRHRALNGAFGWYQETLFTRWEGLDSRRTDQPELVLSPQEAFYSERKSLSLDESVGQVCGEFVMCYPPGIPIFGSWRTHYTWNCRLYPICQGTKVLQGTEDPEVNHINVIKRKENQMDLWFSVHTPDVKLSLRTAFKQLYW